MASDVIEKLGELILALAELILAVGQLCMLAFELLALLLEWLLHLLVWGVGLIIGRNVQLLPGPSLRSDRLSKVKSRLGSLLRFGAAVLILLGACVLGYALWTINNGSRFRSKPHLEAKRGANETITSGNTARTAVAIGGAVRNALRNGRGKNQSGTPDSGGSTRSSQISGTGSTETSSSDSRSLRSRILDKVRRNDKNPASP